MAAPASVDRSATPIERGLKHKTRAQQKRDIIIQQTVVEPQVVVINNNLDTIAALALTAEQEFAALVQSQLALISTVETIKNNIRVNHFKNSKHLQVHVVCSLDLHANHEVNQDGHKLTLSLLRSQMSLISEIPKMSTLATWSTSSRLITTSLARRFL